LSVSRQVEGWTTVKIKELNLSRAKKEADLKAKQIQLDSERDILLAEQELAEAKILAEAQFHEECGSQALFGLEEAMSPKEKVVQFLNGDMGSSVLVPAEKGKNISQEMSELLRKAPMRLIGPYLREKRLVYLGQMLRIGRHGQRRCRQRQLGFQQILIKTMQIVLG